jgi:GTP cyclohydrolase I
VLQVSEQTGTAVQEDLEGQLALASVINILQYIGEGLHETPARVVRSWREIYGGYRMDPAKILKTFDEKAPDEMVVLDQIEFYSTCEHHMQPFFGRAAVAYIPDGRVVGISKLARLVDVYARRLQIQERLTAQVTEALDNYLKPKGSACVIRAKHFCMLCRGVRKQNSIMTTSSLTGVFRDNPSARLELMSLIQK